MPKPDGVRAVSRPTAKISADKIARAALDLLNETGLDGLTMRLVARQLDVQAAALYWHVRNKQQLLDVMAALMSSEAGAGFGAPEPGADWVEVLTAWAGALRAEMLRYRDGARVFAGSNVSNDDTFRMVELMLRILRHAGFTLAGAAGTLSVVLHYTIGYTIEEQARTGVDYGQDNPYLRERLIASVDPERFPLVAAARDDLYGGDQDGQFAGGLRVIIAGLRAVELDG